MIVYPIRHGSYPELSSFQTAVLSDFLSSAFRKALPLRLQEIYNRRSETRSLFVSVKNQSTENVVKSKASTKKQPRLEEDSSTVTYLINSCGLSPESAILASQKRTTWIFLEDPSKNLVPNITRLSELGVPQSCIILLLTHFPEAVMQKHEQFSKIVDEVKEMGFDVKKTTFVLAVHALSGKGNKSTWERCYEVYKRWGWSHDMILEAFRKHPHCMMLSEGKIMKGMDFLVNKMGYPSQVIAQFPMGLFFSLERRIIPRCRVIQVLSSKRLIKDGLSLASFLVPVEKCFLERFVNKYYAEIPQLLSVYEGKLNPEDV
ncbi:uncharacterized protein LOC119983302 isoform X2 [Tripterygium wilfordii]|uniref:uncharacterized protein LOC119983302 isoform X2 n=1 Tax=Tripterygium wilfordii TaxID=458696 RepID=UPI0018F80D2C|nr:uncharacterized protein LOC119983302 isoform X2 [Tripterygium wilfordii]